MVKHLDREWELERPDIFHHIKEVYGVLGGWKGLLIFFVGLYLFYSYILYTIANGKKRREQAKELKRKQ